MKEYHQFIKGKGYSGYYKYFKFSDTLGGKLYTFVCVFEYQFEREDGLNISFGDVLLENHYLDRIEIAENANVWVK